MKNMQRVMMINGMLVILIAMFAGFMLLFQLVGGLEVWPGYIVELPSYGTTDGWVRAHTGGILNGVLVMVVALALPMLDLSEFKNKFMAYGFSYVAWSFTLFYWIGNAVANRALTLGDNPLGESSFLSVLGFLPGLPSVLVVVILLVIGINSLVGSVKND